MLPNDDGDFPVGCTAVLCLLVGLLGGAVVCVALYYATLIVRAAWRS